MEVRLETLPPRHLAGLRAVMTFSDDQTPALWRRFMPHRHAVAGRVGAHLVSVHRFEAPLEGPPTPHTRFTRWAAAEVTPGTEPPDGLEACTLAGGLYAVFVHRGPATAFAQTLRAFFETWLPASGYTMDAARARFEVLPPGYRPDDPDAEEEVYLPVRPV